MARKRPVSFKRYAYTDVNPALRGGDLGDKIAGTAPRFARKQPGLAQALMAGGSVMKSARRKRKR